MLNDTHFKYELIRKYGLIFSNMFNNITMLRTDPDNNEILRTKVPIVFGPKEHWVTRLKSDPDLLRELQTVLPRMSYEVTGYAYDASRKQNTMLRTAKGDDASRVTSLYMAVPYDINFSLSIYARNVADGQEIVEQILPYFTPDFTVTVNVIPELGFLKDIPIILNEIQENINYEGNYETERFVNWTLNFTVKGYFFGPSRTPKIIRKVIANIFNDPSLVIGNVIRINTDRGNNGNFQLMDVVYQGTSEELATAYGYVTDWNFANKKLTIGGAHGNFSDNATIRAISTNATYNIASFDETPLKLTKIVVEPEPNTAMPGDNFGYNTTIQEYPDIQE